MEITSQIIQQAKSRFGIVGTAPALTEAVSRALRVAPIDLSVLVTGESGSGKEFFPQIIHAYSPRKHSKYIAVNCGAIPEGTIDSELFGHEKGAFTGAVATRKGYFEEANGGTIFLDEVAELPLTTQARLLRVLESGEFMKVGSSTVQRTDIRVVAATNVDMARAVREGRFREDLFYRLSTVEIHVPPLRERGGDILLLTRKFAADFAEKYRVPQFEFTQEAREAMTRFRWPGNVRQLKNVVEQIALFEAGKTVDLQRLESYQPTMHTSYAPAVADAGRHSYEHEREMLFNMILRLQSEIGRLKAEIEETRSGATPGMAQPQVGDGRRTEQPATSAALMKYPAAHSLFPTPMQSHQVKAEQPDGRETIDVTATPETPAHTARESRTLEETERETIRESLERNGGRRKATAAELNISERTLYRKIKEYGLE